MGALLLVLALGGLPEPPPEGAAASGTPRRAGLAGWDASDVSDWFSLRVPRVEPELLEEAPTSPTVATLASGATVLTGLALVTGSLLVTLADATTPLRLPLLAVPLGAVLVNFGPNVGDLLNGDWPRALRMGLGRLVLLALSAVVPYGGLAWAVWATWDVVQARHAPARWVARRTPPEGF
jgi:hypothetical protein